MHSRQEKLEAFGRLLDVLDTLREKCPWDRKQTNESLRPNTIEEVYELCDALMADDELNIKKELGDVLLHVAFYSKIADEKGQFDIADVCNSLTDKLIFRHPHIYGDVKADTPDAVADNWEQIKLKEKDGNKTVLSGVPGALPALVKAYRIQEKAAHVGFDWDCPDQVWDKVREEMAEVETEIKAGNKEGTEQEFGDLFFSVVNAARLYGVVPENALELTNRKFIRRFNYLEAKAKETGRNLKEMTLGEMDEIWNEAKRME
ncbi:MAG: nucleoside triphosphate pyrophosphohydrolase [Muribaculaceae bacterium]|nr:nucleoside triphosphate pyrophosphohydrolase [Muribaculaceae bacterium]